MHDKDFWRGIIEKQGALPDDANFQDLTDELLGYLRSPDGELRDRFAYQLLAHWIVSGKYEEVQLRKFLLTWQNNLQEDLGEAGTDSVLVRSFAALMLSILLYADIQKAWMSAEDSQNLSNVLLSYFPQEVDYRGYDEEKGWLHATAHTADALKFLARHPKSDKVQLERILEVLEQKLKTATSFFTYGEDERLALVVLDILKRQLLEEDTLKTYLEKFKELPHGMVGTSLDSKQYIVHQNGKNFLKALYFVLAKNKELEGASNLEYAIYSIMKDY